ncbi:MAG: translation initiation factor IF-2 [Acidobacteria bacterium]|nr:translation initiation factor IF-2 [Acidobacteriota bacterium]
MDKVNVNDLAQEFNVKSSLVMTELKKIGVMVISPETPVDHGIAERVRKRLQLLADQALEEEQKAERAREKAAKAKEVKKETPSARPRVRKSIKQLGKKVVEEPTALAQQATPPAEPLPALQVPPPEEAAPVAEAAVGKRKIARVRVAKRLTQKEAAIAVEKPKVEPQISPSMKPRKGKKHFTKEDELVAVAEAPLPPPLPVSPVSVAEERPPEKVTPAAAGGAKVVIEPVEVQPIAARESQMAKPVPAPSLPSAGPVPPAIHRPAPEVRRPVAKSATILKKSSAEPLVTDIAKKIERIVPSAPPLTPRPAPARAQLPHRKERKVEAPPIPRVPPPRPERPVFTEFKPVTLSEAVTVKELSEKLNVRSKDILRELLNRGMLVAINQMLDEKIAGEICELFGFKPHFLSFEEELFERQAQVDRPEDRLPRAPVVTVMGHVDHGKTSLLDAIREARVAEKEAGGITQHIGAYHVEINNRRIVFLDTPGHEAFTLMRARGTKVTDIVVLVVAADDGVMPQTVEAINHARAAHVPIIVAINKTDKPGANVERVKQQLAEHNLLAEDWGGDTVTVPVSALMKTNLDLLLEMILLVADLLDLKANQKLAGTGAVLEAKLDKGRGAVATVLIQNGTVTVGGSFIAGAVYGKVRAMFDDRGRSVEQAGPATAVEVLGLEGIPAPGDAFQVLDDTFKAKQIGSVRQARLRERDLQKSSRLTLDHLYERLKAGDVKELTIVLKADVQGSVEVLADSLQKLSTEKVKVRIVHTGVGAITESDVLLASASNAIIVGFSVRPEKSAAELAEQEGVDIRLHTVIYNVANEIRNAMLGLLETTLKEKHLGRVEVRETFRVPKVGIVAGGYVLDGTVLRNAEARLLRDNVVVYEGKIRSLRRFKEDVGEVKTGYECGFSLENFNDVKIGDVVEVFTQEKVEPKLM